jgi:hypothetical protein
MVRSKDAINKSNFRNRTKIFIVEFALNANHRYYFLLEMLGLKLPCNTLRGISDCQGRCLFYIRSLTLPQACLRVARRQATGNALAVQFARKWLFTTLSKITCCYFYTKFITLIDETGRDFPD